MVEVESHLFACGYPVFAEWFAGGFLSLLCVSASSGRVNRLKCLGLLLTLFHRLIQGGKLGGEEAGKREHTWRCGEVKPGCKCALCRVLAELRGTVGRMKQGLFVHHILMEKNVPPASPRDTGSCQFLGLWNPTRVDCWISALPGKAVPMSLSAGLSNK